MTKSIGSPGDIASADAFLGEALLAQHKYSEAKRYFNSALLYATKNSDRKFEKEMERVLANCSNGYEP